MSDLPRLTLADFPAWVTRLRRPHHEQYYAMYSSVYGGIVTDAVLMMVPADDHLVHRGDGVFETLKCVDGGIYNLDAHLNRLFASASQIALAPPCTLETLRHLIAETVRAGDRRDVSIRVLVSRGPGSLSVNPYESTGAEVYIVVGRPSKTPGHLNTQGARACSSTVPVKPGFFATIKSCNYLPNVIMKKEAVDLGVDYVLSFDENGFLAEGPSESAAVVTCDRRLLMPTSGRILPGTTMQRAAELAGELVREGLLRDVAPADIPRSEVISAREILILGTTPDVIPVIEFDGRPIGEGQPGPVAKALAQLLQDDMAGDAVRTPVFPPSGERTQDSR